MTTLYGYGENSFTFMLFASLCEGDRVRNILLKNLRGFINRKLFPLRTLSTIDPEVYLFPNFGKSDGFGEPDALIIVGKHTFWVEVETSVAFRGGFSKLKQSLRQLFRFHLLASAIGRGASVRKDVSPRHGLRWCYLGRQVRASESSCSSGWSHDPEPCRGSSWPSHLLRKPTITYCCSTKSQSGSRTRRLKTVSVKL